jgi:hypothetical protein
MTRKVIRLVFLFFIVSLAIIFGCSDTSTAVVIGTVATPQFNPPAGSYTGPKTISISSSTLGVTILYTTDGTDPHSDSAVYTAPFTIYEDTIVKAKAFREGWKDSKTASANYSIDIPIEEIRAFYREIAEDFILGNVYGILDKVHNDYLHDGNVVWHLSETILDRLQLYNHLEFEVLSIEFIGEQYATVTSLDYYSSSTDTVIYHEPEDSGYFSYLYKEDDVWMIIGNQMWAR